MIDYGGSGSRRVTPMDNSERMVGGLYMPDVSDETTPRRALFKIKPVSNMGPWRKWVAFSTYGIAGCGSLNATYAHTLPEAFGIISRWLGQFVKEGA